MFIVVTILGTEIKEAFNVSTVKHIVPTEQGSILDINGKKIEVKEHFDNIISQTKTKRIF